MIAFAGYQPLIRLVFLLIEMEAATPAESARTEDPGLSIAKEAVEVVPAESVRSNGNQHFNYSPKDTTP